MKRLPGEDFDAYRQRRKEANVFRKMIGHIGRLFYQGGTYRKKEVVLGPKRVLISAASGKRHKGESIEHFKQRRRVCNAKRREREGVLN